MFERLNLLYEIENEIDQAFIDPNIVRIVPMNLISNALKYSENNGTICLSAFKNLSRIHKGKIKVESQERQGITFEIEFPCNHLVE